jgi:hypothetical protein
VEYREIHREDDPEKSGLQRNLVYDLRAVRPDGGRVTLLGWLREPDHAVFLERWIERRLGIEERRVPGERA